MKGEAAARPYRRGMPWYDLGLDCRVDENNVAACQADLFFGHNSAFSTSVSF
jgi:hypothetical protein